MNPEDVENVLIPPVEDAVAVEVETAWNLFAAGSQAMHEAVAGLEAQLFAPEQSAKVDRRKMPGLPRTL